ncbi:MULTISPECIES: hypothetical protein [Cellulosimicrobium]|jgi:hypothetical protein|uniref:Uncharacterized protein n=1 Tax=Cellulosimicrobium cellulans TaxID=1710 RepID=A0A1Y0HU63_CELCE|nr:MULTISPECIES: hypothetical protein [Cellulosimicrobium]ARU51056.1 hypothetical protein CBR64_05695 [Cellulosimicrobium cellulans]MBM7821516.1 hypothetical protein [Cellulosimicrobium cellulans]MCO7274805.1 hypothetical protein [Cellulosimicrobium cellulans]
MAGNDEVRRARVPQGAQAEFADVRVGVMRVGVGAGRALAQLAVRSPRGEDVLRADLGDAIDLHGAGMLHVDDVEGEPGSSGGAVTFTFTPA